MLPISQNYSYDEVPYESCPYVLTSPYHLNTIAALFGMNPPSVESARILELGCASGGNIIPHAINYPDAQIVGIDMSKVQIDEANKHKDALGLENIDFHNCSIIDVNESFGKFDYIICHGVISWAPKAIRDKIFEVSSNSLTENGVVYISYNTLPGWNMIRSIRDMMLFHTSKITDIKEKINQSRLFLQFVRDSLVDANSPYTMALKTEIEILVKKDDSYLYHEHLEKDNKQYYFYEFIEDAKQYNLQYLSDSVISTMYLGNLPSSISEKLQEINDLVTTEQYIDFITNRRFRSSLLCHKFIELNSDIKADDITKFHMICNVIPEKLLVDIDLNSPEPETFYHNGLKESGLSFSSPYMKAIFYVFYENINNPINLDDLIIAANAKLGGNKHNEIKSEFLNNAMRLVLQGYIKITTEHSRGKISLERPKTTRLILYQVINTPNMWVTNLNHELIGINLFEKYALKYMDGTHDLVEILDSVMKHVLSGELTINKNGIKIENIDEIRKELESGIEVALTKFSFNAVLV